MCRGTRITHSPKQKSRDNSNLKRYTLDFAHVSWVRNRLRSHFPFNWKKHTFFRLLRLGLWPVVESGQFCLPRPLWPLSEEMESAELGRPRFWPKPRRSSLELRGKTRGSSWHDQLTRGACRKQSEPQLYCWTAELSAVPLKKGIRLKCGAKICTCW